MLMKFVFLAIALPLLVSGCGRDINIKDLEKKKVDEIYKEGEDLMKSGRYSDAASILEELEKLYPYSHYTAKAQLLEGECYYKAKKYDEAITAFSVFVKTHPTHESVPYALYMLGSIEYEQMLIVERDQGASFDSMKYFRELEQMYPDSKYATLANEKIKSIRQHIAGQEIYIARYYQDRNNFPAAINRLNIVMKNYPETEHCQEAMLHLVECYLSLGLIEEAAKIDRILQSKYKDSKWAIYSTDTINKAKR